ncbi:hypothetical protein EHI8A_033880 [Entamoeba histolytica HM-1:IMSS-B]|uniref:GRAM domain-containing protein n=4 Tax=Entamoeba histolytica TaxID=5759 RepID=B1N340_ENTH1|nr:hypothetical protein EHI_104510 [Entamoeba histolytica HM-1:IMSS]EDS89616.1 hypothetical protein EHI_104510 [Entamoeba histolytica HM-1:IMSS]EMH73941.1 hypothetical protein EHI8A_033880 [Entamoeba histolytica HM-1:IMSS-B]ENY60878.1 hypothetical protein EHI7A_035770 [Entamoeba histolytica HM-1:IMSS-A]|eukprot:XP_001913606.1 hypothetical protein EHI_104510 [Entamoeba histolytica HM-1:IMSS]
MLVRVASRIESEDRAKASKFIKVNQELRSQFGLSENEDVVQNYKGVYKSGNTNVKGTLFLTQNYFYIKDMNNQIMLLDVQGRRYEFYPTFNKEECYNLMHYLFQFPFALLDLNIYKHHTEISSEHLDQETKFDIQTAQEALDTAEDMRKIKLDSYQMLESQQRKIAMIDQLLNQTDVYLGEIEESIKATTSLVKPAPRQETPILQQQIIQNPPQKVEINIIWKLEGDNLIPAIMTIYDDKVVLEETSNEKKKLLTREFAIVDMIGLFMRSRPLHMNIALNHNSKEKGRVRIVSVSLQFICNELYIRYLKLTNEQLGVIFEPNSRVFDYGDTLITKTFMNCGPIKGQIKFEQDEDFALNLLTGKDREDYLALKKTNQNTLNILDECDKLGQKTIQMAEDSAKAIESVSLRMKAQKELMNTYKQKSDQILKWKRNKLS